tara:strand:+ start:1302 stop:1604 length:303 start_codon:yes stop_codon:yes gene_type:complete
MPSKSKAQHNLMAAVANNPKFAKKAGIPQTVGADYMKADKDKKYKSGGLAMVEKGGKKVPFYAADGVGKMNMGGSVMKYNDGGKIRGYGMARGGRPCKMR